MNWGNLLLAFIGCCTAGNTIPEKPGVLIKYSEDEVSNCLEKKYIMNR